MISHILKKRLRGFGRSCNKVCPEDHSRFPPHLFPRHFLSVIKSYHRCDEITRLQSVFVLEASIAAKHIPPVRHEGFMSDNDPNHDDLPTDAQDKPISIAEEIAAEVDADDVEVVEGFEGWRNFQEFR